MYSPDLGRFSSLDPHADYYNSWTPYNYVANNPVLLIDPDGRDWVINKTEKDGKTNYDIQFVAAIVNDSKNTSVDDIIALAVNISNQIDDAFTIDEDNVTTSVSVNIRVSKDGKTNDNEHVFRVTDDLPSDEAGKADIGGREILINSRQVDKINKLDTDPGRDITTGPHEAGHTGGLHHPDAQFGWWPSQWQNWRTPTDQYLNEGQDDDNLMYSGEYRVEHKQNLNNGGKGYKINANQARILYENRDNKKKKK